jgi:hypothetical protein|uniref:Uncharacterized protein n=1 Tax=Bacteroides fragilis TaxID=817 RepID=A0A0I9USK3_BACFG|nr:MAG TPA: hypothetical protein [Caudoviricetes sp.]
MLSLEEVTNVRTDGEFVIIEITLFTALLRNPSSKRAISIRLCDFWRVVDAVDYLSGLKVKNNRI